MSSERKIKQKCVNLNFFYFLSLIIKQISIFVTSLKSFKIDS